MTNPHNHLYCEQYAEVSKKQNATTLRLTPLNQAHRPCLLPLTPHPPSLNSGEVHARRAGEPGAGQEVLRPGAAAEQPKHEGLVWSVHGE